MNQRALVSFLALAFAATACVGAEVKTASPAARHYDRKCQTGDACTVLVYVKGDCTKEGDVSVDASTLAVSTGTKDLDIHWILKNRKFHFAKAGVEFKTAQKEFVNPDPGAEVFSWHDLNNGGGTPGREYPYRVRLLNQAGAACWVLDPTVINDL